MPDQLKHFAQTKDCYYIFHRALELVALGAPKALATEVLTFNEALFGGKCDKAFLDEFCLRIDKLFGPSSAIGSAVSTLDQSRVQWESECKIENGSPGPLPANAPNMEPVLKTRGKVV